MSQGEKGFVCPNCSADMGAQDVICVQCGYDCRTGAAYHAQTARVKSVPGLKKIGFGVVSFCALIVLAGGLYYVFKPQAPKSEPPPIVQIVPQEAADPPSYDWNAYSPNEGYHGNLYDLLVLFSIQENRDISIDPDVTALLVGKKIDLSNEQISQSSIALIPNILRREGLTVQKSKWESREIDFITTPARMAYYRAVQSLGQNNIPQAMALLAQSENSGTEYDGHCNELNKALSAIMAIKLRMELCGSIIDESGGRYIAANSRRKSLVRDILSAQVVAFWQDLETYQQPILERLVSSMNNHQTSECKAIAWYLEKMMAWVASMEQRLQAAGIVSVQTWKNTRAASSMFGDLYASYSASAEKSNSIAMAGPADMDDAFHGISSMAKGVYLDRAAPLPRIIHGELNMRKSAQSIESLLLPSSRKALHMDQLAESYAKTKPLWADMIRRKGTPLGGAHYSIPQLIGTSRGLVVLMGEGSVSPFMASSALREPIKVTTSRYDKTAFMVQTYDYLLYRGVVTGVEITQWMNQPMFFFEKYSGDVGDSFWISAHQACLWLKSELGEKFPDNRSLRLQWHDLVMPIDGDSAGAAIALAGYSTLARAPLRQDVAMTGSIRADGTIKAVGGINAKALGALLEENINVVIVPRENEADLYATPIDQLCQQIIIVADHVSDYKKYASVQTDENLQVQKAIEDTIDAIVQLQIGKYEDAYRGFNRVANKNPEIYNARRLLEYMQLYGKRDIQKRSTGVASTWYIAEPPPARRPAKNTSMVQLYRCSQCWGRGYLACKTCGGSGVWTGIGQPICPDCGGKGRLDAWKQCNRCAGNGRITGTLTAECPGCQGVGIHKCGSCSGLGTRLDQSK